MPKKKIISEKVKSSESLGDSKGIIMLKYRPLEWPLAYEYVANCLYEIAKNDQSFYIPPHSSGYHGKSGVEECVVTIQNCINEGRVDLIEKAARLLQGDKKLLALIRLRDTAAMCTDQYPEEYRTDDAILPTKAAVRKVFELMYPDLKEHFPTSKRQQAEWWAEVGYDHLPQDRRAEDTPSVKFWLQELKGELPGPTNS